jgi:hypothetical protein
MARDEDTPLPKLPPSAPVLNDVESAPGSRAATPPATVPASPVSPTREKEKGKDRRAGKKGGGLTEGDEGELVAWTQLTPDVEELPKNNLVIVMPSCVC